MKLIYVYNDFGSSEFCVRALMECFRMVYGEQVVRVETINAADILSGRLTKQSLDGDDDYKTTLLCMGGGFDLGYEKMLGARGVEIVREFVSQGGFYLGICAGAYFATDFVQFDLNGPLQVLGLWIYI